MTTNPETAGVEPVAWLYTKGESAVVSLSRLSTDGELVAYKGWTETPLYAHPPAAREDGEAGWIVGNSAGTAWRTWENGCCTWVKEREFATRYARREDAENIHREDEDAWTIVPFATTRPAPEQAPQPKCFECGDSGEVFGHADDCDNDSCALNGDIDSCLGKVEPCGCAPLAPDHANCAVGEGEPTPEPTPQQGLGEFGDLSSFHKWFLEYNRGDCSSGTYSSDEMLLAFYAGKRSA